MASQGYRDWIAARYPYVLARPLADTRANLLRHGLVVYHYPDAVHQQAVPPEDHCPYSATGWPVPSKRWVGHAIDIMPRDSSLAARIENAAIARQMIFDKDAGYPAAQWIKYLNWTDEAGICRHVAWQPNKTVTTSTDRGHVHASSRSDMDTWAGAAGYDPYLRMDMAITDADAAKIASAVWLKRFTGTNESGPYNFSAEDMLTGANAASWKCVGYLEKVLTALGELEDLIIGQDDNGTLPDTAIIIKRIDDLRTQVQADTRDALADAAEGSAAAMRTVD